MLDAYEALYRTVATKTMMDICASSTDWDDIWAAYNRSWRLAARLPGVVHRRPMGWEHFLRYPDMRNNRLRRWSEGA
jgi:hypothetical protein